MSLHHSARGRLGLAIGAFGASALLLAGCAGGGGGTHRRRRRLGRAAHRRHDRQGHHARPGRLVRQRLARRADPGLPVPGQHRLQQHRGRARPRRVRRVHLADRVHGHPARRASKWANGNDLTSSDVKFSFDRNIAIADPNGASSLLYNLDSVETPDDTTVVFKLKTENDQIFPQILTSFPAAIVDEECFAADAITPDEDIVEANAFGGPYIITSYTFNETVEFAPNPRATRACSPLRQRRRHH